MSRTPFDTGSLGAPQDEVAHRLRAVRESLGLSLRGFAARLSAEGTHVSHTAVTKYEHHELKITPDYVDLVARATGIPFGWFLSGVGSEESPPSAPALRSSGLDVLPSYLHRSITERLEGLADWCGIPPGPGLEEFYAQVGAMIRAPFSDNPGHFRPWSELTERELSVYIATQFATLRNLLRRLGEVQPAGDREGGPSP